jgi:oxaloacetate decarboxylase alpha subunit
MTSQVPGGMLSNLESQLRDQGKLDRLDAVLDEIAVVQKEFGYPPLVTPTSQIVGTQAVLNVLLGRYARLTSESRDLLAGRYGRTPAEPDPALLTRALTEAGLDQPVRHRPADDIPNELPRIEEELRGKMQTPRVSTEDVLTYAMFPQVALQFFAKRPHGPVSIEAPEVERRAPPSGRYVVSVNGREYRVRRGAAAQGGTAFDVDGATFQVSVREAAGDDGAPAAGADKGHAVLAPMPGEVCRLTCDDGERIAAGATIAMLEAMKLQLEIKSKEAGTIRYKVRPGESVRAEQVLAVVT